MIQPIVLLVILIFLNATFASAEIAVLSVNETRLKRMAEEGNSRAGKLVSLTRQPARFLATIQVAITLAGLLQSAFAAENFADPLVEALVSAGVTVAPAVLKSISIVVITLVLAYFNLVFGELVPKRVAMKKSESLALGMSGMLFWVSRIFAPLVWLLTASTNLILKLMGLSPEEEEDVVTEEEIRMLLVEGKKQGNIQAEETKIIQNVFEFDDISAKEICTHRREAIILRQEDSLQEWDQVIRANRHTYYPVSGENRDDIVGVLDSRDYFRLKEVTRENVLTQCVEPAFFVPESMKANRLFQQMREKRNYFAVLIDEYGGMSGIVTVHDLMEALVGQLEEEGEEEKPQEIQETGENQWLIQGWADLKEVARTLEVKLPTEECDTFSGYICGVIGRVPRNGEQFACESPQLRIQVHGVENHMITQATVTRLNPEEEGPNQKE